ncbi:hypothetical protein VTL71DRAFT_11471 [Oculimacula yallundae]|uniref:Uncharacterized protein n=1 Tax=Oculimacula yallundae TaxID=86028 RepID=A0ABR4CRZ3_9HELO
MKLKSTLPLYLLISTQKLGSAQQLTNSRNTITWDDLASEMPGAKTVLIYCDAINRNLADCAQAFLGHGTDTTQAGSSYVSRAAAQICLDRSGKAIELLEGPYQLFDVGMDALASRASGGGAGGSEGFQPNTYSDEAKDVAGKRGWNEEVAKIESIHRLEDEARSKDPFFGGRNPDNRIHDGEVGDARDDPSSVGQPPDLDCAGESCWNSAGQHTDPTGALTPVPEPPGPDTPIPETEPPGFVPTPKEDFKPILEETDLTEERDRTLWDSISTKTFDPSPIVGEQVTEEEAQLLFSQGICDISYFGEAYCRTWQKQRDTATVTTEWQDTFDAVKMYSPLCPVNLVDIAACEEMKIEVGERYVMPAVMNAMFEPGRPVSWLPGRNMDPSDKRAVESEWLKQRNGQETVLGSRAGRAGRGFIALSRPIRESSDRPWQAVLGRMVVQNGSKPQRTCPGRYSLKSKLISGTCWHHLSYNRS